MSRGNVLMQESSYLKEIQENFLADIQVEVAMNEVPPDLIIN